MREKIPQKIPESVTAIPLPPLPQVLIRLLALLEDDHAPLADVATLAAHDPALAAHLLGAANSPACRKEPVGNGLESCLKTIGIQMLRTIANAMAVRDVFSPPLAGQNFDHLSFWLHSLHVAELARSLAVAINYPDAEEAHLTGLLHDIGHLLLVCGEEDGCSIPDASPAACTAATGHQNGPEAADPAAVGSHLVEQWNLSSFIADAVLFHRHPADEISSADVLSRIVWSAHLLNARDPSDEASNRHTRDMTTVSSLLGIDTDGIASACKDSRLRVADRAASLGVELSGGNQSQISGAAPLVPSSQSPSPHNDNNAARFQLGAKVRTLAALQPLQQSLLSLSGESEFFGALCESSLILFGLGRPAFMVVHPDRPVLTGAKVDGQSPLLARLEIPVDAGQGLVPSVFNEKRPRSSFDTDYPSAPPLVDIQICRILHAEGLLCIPMCTGERSLGVIIYGLAASQSPRSRGYREAMTGFACAAAATLESFRTLRTRGEGIEAELARAYAQSARKVVHEAANPLGIINNYLMIVSRKLGEESGVRRELEILKEEITRVEGIIRRLADHAEHPPVVESVDVNRVIEGMLALYGESLFEARGIGIDTTLSPVSPVARADRDSLKQILLNLWKNSAEAMADGGRFRITTRVATNEQGEGIVEIHVVDTGPGIPPDVMERLFQPLDPNRRPAHSGVGLSIVASLVARLAGTISCQSSPDRGTEFTLRLPQARKETT